METQNRTSERRTSVDTVFNHLYKEINALRLLPGAKISEAEIATRFGVSRQPVRDAFSKLENLDLLLIRPQKATEVKRFSHKAIVKSRFIRAAVEAEVIRLASERCNNAAAARMDACLDEQKTLVDAGNYDGFSKLDYEFHKTLCEVAEVDFAFEVIASEKAKLDRLCVLSLSAGDRLSQLLDDHQQIVDNVKQGNAQQAVAAGMLHLSRLDATIEKISAENTDYFDQ
jgi:DNA-binding GntR family transcriptional regulator